VTATASPLGARPSPWILGPARDWALFLATPLLILPAVRLVLRGVALADLALFVASFGALGHHLPGMLRAYGDRELFRRFRVRFVLAPVLLVGGCVAAALAQWSGLLLVVYLWGLWHGLAQTYGFLRIYDAKVRSTALLTCRLDLALCVAWFLGLAVLSPTRLREVASLLYQTGVAPLSAGAVAGLRSGAAWTIAVVSAAFLVHALVAWRRGTPPSALKLALMGTSFGFWWFANVHVQSLLLGVLLFELFHDVQYLAIVWAFSRQRAAKGADLGGWNRLLFRGGWTWTGLYVGLVFAYGTLNYGAQGLGAGPARDAALGVLAASALLHFYYDGFIWKVRERGTAQSLGLAGGSESARARPAWLRHAAKWLLLLGPLGGLAVAQARGGADTLARTEALARDFGQAKDHAELGLLRLAQGTPAAAAESFRAALAREPELAAARVGLGDALFLGGDVAGAEREYRAALAQAESAGARNGLGNVLGARGERGAALAEYRRAVALDAELLPARANLGLALASQGALEEAAAVQGALVAECPACPDVLPVHVDLARSLVALGRPEEARRALESALAHVPDEPGLLRALAELELEGGESARALARYELLLARDAADPEALYGAANALALLGRLEEAVALYRRALVVRPGFPEAHRNLGTVLLQRGELAAAEDSLRTAVRLAASDGEAHQRLAAALRARGREREAEPHEALARRLSGQP